MIGILAEIASGTHYEFGRLQMLTQWWQWLLLLGCCAGVLTLVIVLYVRDSVELPSGVAFLLTTLRVLAFAGILFYFMDLQKRTQELVTQNSRVAVLVDTSQSMALADEDTGSPSSRIRQVVDEFSSGTLLGDLREKHDVVVYAFDDTAQPREVASLQRTSTEAASPTVAAEQEFFRNLKVARWTALAAAGVFLISLLAGGYYLLSSPQRNEEDTSWALLISVVTLIAAVVVLATANLRSADAGLLAILGLRQAEPPQPAVASEDEDAEANAQQVDWAAALSPKGGETRIGDAIRYIVNKERGGPIAGIVLFSDGAENSGAGYSVAVQVAADAQIAVHAVGLGSNQRPLDIRVADFEAPERVYPGDAFKVTGFIQSFGLDGRNVKVELYSVAAAEDTTNATERFEEERRLTLSEDGKINSVEFELVLEEDDEDREYRLRVAPVSTERDISDNEMRARVQVAKRKNRVLLFAGGPTREFRFLRNALFRDRDTQTTVLLQSGKPGISQEADELLFEFPTTEDELFEFDAIIAFDPDWLALDDIQTDLLEKWVAEKAGGLICIAGPVHTPQWANVRNNQRVSTIRSLYPVNLYTPRSAALSLGRFGGEDAWPLEFTRDGLESEFLWLEDDLVGSEQAWASFSGVYGYYAVKDPKPGATVYARFSDPSTKIDNELPIYLAGHIYGAGRVFFQASGEMWRVRAVDDTYFETYYIKLIRWVSQGRLLRDSTRGVLLTDKSRAAIGDNVIVRAILSDAQHRPLEDESVPAVVVYDGIGKPLELLRVKDAAWPGLYSGQFTVLREGNYQIQLKTMDGSEQVLTREVESRMREKEIRQPERNDALLKEITVGTEGQYFVGLPAAVGEQTRSVASYLEPRDQTTMLSGTPDKNFERLLMGWLMGCICGVLCMEWLIRRLSKLA